MDCFSDKEIKLSNGMNGNRMQKRFLFTLSIIILMGYVISLQLKQAHLLLPLIFMIYLIFYRNILRKVDWLLLLLFIVIFIDFHVISVMPAIAEGVSSLNLHSGGNVFLFSMFSSQLMSNVPASVLVSEFSHNWFAITYGVNVGGNGLVIGSLANIIALRMAKGKKIWLNFHKYSVPYFLITGSIAYILFFVL